MIPNRPRRWFIYSSVGLLVFLCLAITLAAFLLLRRGKLPRTGVITGSSMEPILQGPRYKWTCFHCASLNSFALDTCKRDKPLRCPTCNKFDVESVIDWEDTDLLKDKTQPGEQVRFATLRSVRTMRAPAIASGLALPSGLQRGDVVIFQESVGAKREVKRIVGFAGEQVSIVDGDVFVNGNRWSKSLQEALRQSILLKAWDASNFLKKDEQSERSDAGWKMEGGIFQGELNADLGVMTFSPRSSGAIDNQLPINAHDSHAIVRVHDFGLALQISKPDESWSMDWELCSPMSRPKVAMGLVDRVLTIKSADQVYIKELTQQDDKSVWLVVVMVDGELVIGSQDEEWLRTKLPQITIDVETAIVETKPPIQLSVKSGTIKVDHLMVFRDIHYRGRLDSETQTWERGDSVVVLGDNVSASSDSRDRWPDGLPTNAVKGIVLQSENPMEDLLKQR